MTRIRFDGCDLSRFRGTPVVAVRLAPSDRTWLHGRNVLAIRNPLEDDGDEEDHPPARCRRSDRRLRLREQAVAITHRLALRKARVRLIRGVRLLLDAGPVAERDLVHDVRAPVAGLADVPARADR